MEVKKKTFKLSKENFGNFSIKYNNKQSVVDLIESQRQQLISSYERSPTP
jgi:hypothetical protein